MKLKDMSSGYYSTSPTLQNLEKIADNMNESHLMQQGNIKLSERPTAFRPTKSIVQSLWTSFVNLFK